MWKYNNKYIKIFTMLLFWIFLAIFCLSMLKCTSMAPWDQYKEENSLTQNTVGTWFDSTAFACFGKNRTIWWTTAKPFFHSFPNSPLKYVFWKHVRQEISNTVAESWFIFYLQHLVWKFDANFVSHASCAGCSWFAWRTVKRTGLVSTLRRTCFLRLLLEVG